MNNCFEAIWCLLWDQVWDLVLHSFLDLVSEVPPLDLFSSLSNPVWVPLELLGGALQDKMNKRSHPHNDHMVHCMNPEYLDELH